MREITIEKERWRNGEQYLVLNGGFNELFDERLQEVVREWYRAKKWQRRRR